jgi:UDP-N-acetylglucosamine--N-acetylmuramyl-(pentapeptide) pyrophosphoryl-undecaprenol N-acetylglucosamine transferase
MKFVMAGGGTGGHVIPALAVAEALKARGHEPVFFGTRAGYEARLVPPAGFSMQYIEVGGLNRVGLKQIVRTLWQLPVSTIRSWRWMRSNDPSAVFSMGGYVAGPVILAAIVRGLPLVAMEPNAIPGLTNRKAARWTTRALLNFEESAKFFPPGTSEVTGVPVRDEFFRIPRLTVPSSDRPLNILITGGSQGSRTLNHAGRDSWPLFAKSDLQVRIVHQAGRGNVAGLGDPPPFVTLVEFIQDMPAAFAQADLVIARSGASTVSELAAAGRPSILIPFPYAADDHQRQNARAMARLGAAKVVEDSEWNGERLFSEVAGLLERPEQITRMAEAATAAAKPGAAERAAKILEKLGAERR